MERKALSLSALGLMLSGSLGMTVFPSMFRSQFLAPVVGSMASMFAIGSGVGIARKHQLQPSDFASGLKFAVDGFYYVGEADLKPAVQKIIQIESLPPALKTQAQKLIDISSDLRWLDEFLKASFLAAGVKNSGKTVFLHFAVSRFLENYPKGTLRIHDHNYGKRGNTWFNLPAATPDKTHTGHEMVFMDDGSLFDLVTEAHGEYLNRKRLVQEGRSPKFEPYLLVITELSNHFRRIGKDETFTNKVKDLLFESHGYGVFFAGESQSLAVGSLNLSEAERSQLNQILLGSAALDQKEVTRITRGDSDGIIQRVKTLRSTNAGKYAAIANIDGLGVGVHIVPEIDLSTIQIVVPDSAKSEEQRWLESLPWEDIEPIADASITRLWDAYGEGKQSLSNPKYSAFKNQIDQLNNQEIAA